MGGPDESGERRLRRIAVILGIPVEHLFAGAMPAKLADTDECSRLWHRLRTDAGRAAALDCLRAVLDDEAA